MDFSDFTLWQWLLLAERELLLFAGIFFLLGALDEFAVDLLWIYLRLTGRAKTPKIELPPPEPRELTGLAAVFIPTWQEGEVIGATITHALEAWSESAMRLYVGCYRDDIATIEAVIEASRGDPRLRLVINDCAGPSTKADCLNRLYRALELDEARSGEEARLILLHDAEDMVDPVALFLIDQAIENAGLVQLPVRPEPQPSSRWVAGHYCEEFAEAHAKMMVVRDALGVGLPSAGVGCAIARPILGELAEQRGTSGPFAEDCLTEDYELGLGIGAMGHRQRFLRVRDQNGELVATRACFPATLKTAVRQKTRWMHGIAFQGWDRLGWSRNTAESWMRLRDRSGPLKAFVLTVGYALLFLATILWLGHLAGWGEPLKLDPLLNGLLLANVASFLWRAAWRFIYTAREYGWGEGARAVLRIPLANIIAIMAGRRALMAYARTLAGQEIRWDKTAHKAHPALFTMRKEAA